MKEILHLLNPWWNTGKVSKDFLGDYKRTMFEELLKESEKKEVTILIGPRQVGKTTLLYQIIDQLIQDTSPRHIIYINFDEPELRKQSEESLRKILDYYKEYVLGKDFSSEKIYVFLDEVQKLTDWSNQVKFYQDLKLNIKFYSSGSSALHILQGSGESLIGRTRIHKIYSLSFKEISNMNNIRQLKHDMSGSYIELLPKEQEIRILLSNYLLYGGYPAVFAKNQQAVYSRLSDYIDLAIKRDLLDIAEIRDSIVLNDLLNLLSVQCSQKINLEKLGSTLRSSATLISKYMDLLEAAFFVRRNYLYDVNEFVVKRKERKIYFLDNGIRNALIKYIDLQKEEGALAENAVHAKLLETVGESISPKIYFYEDERSTESDFLILRDKEKELIEVKYQNTIGDQDIKTLRKHMQKAGAKMAYLVTKNVFKEYEDLIVLPLWLFLLCYK